MEWSKKWRIIYGIGISFALLIIFTCVSLIIFYRAPTCSDNKQNGSETGVDCGGGCATFCASQVKEPEVVWAKAFPLTPGRYSVAAYVENSNSGAGIKNARYTVRVSDASGKVLLNRDGVRDEIAPSSVFLLFEGNFDFATKPNKVEVEWNKDDINRWEKASKAESVLATKNETLSNPDTKPRFDATLLNTDLVDDVGRVLLGAVIYDSTRNPIAVSSTYVDSAPRGSEQNIFFTWPSRFTTRDKGGICVSPVDTMLVFDRSGSMAQALATAKKAADSYVDASQPADKIGLVSFADTASYPIDKGLSTDHNSVKTAVGNISIQKDSLQYTNLGDALKQALSELSSARVEKNAKHVIVALTDGISNRPLDPKNSKNENYGNEYAATEAQAVRDAKIEIYVVGLGSGVNKTFLRDKIATNSSHYFSAGTAADLKGIYKKISESVCKDESFITEIIITPKAIFTN
ncbi:MAG: VWA domain-containing protein [Candidatus Pacebacteria bacterium]|nr:VWA domain-containing protein [Candidatus Paceibacterota bacterium]